MADVKLPVLPAANAEEEAEDVRLLALVELTVSRRVRSARLREAEAGSGDLRDVLVGTHFDLWGGAAGQQGRRGSRTEPEVGRAREGRTESGRRRWNGIVEG